MDGFARTTPVRTSLLIKLTIAAIVYAAGVQLLSWFIANHPDSRWNPVAATLPVAAVVVVAAAAMISFKGRDEREARMHLEALAFAFVASQLILSIYAFLVFMHVVPFAIEVFLTTMMLLWVVGLVRSAWKYR